MIGKVGVEKCLFGEGVLSIVEGELSDRKVVHPVILLVETVGMKVHFEGLVDTFGKPIGLGMVNSG